MIIVYVCTSLNLANEMWSHHMRWHIKETARESEQSQVLNVQRKEQYCLHLSTLVNLRPRNSWKVQCSQNFLRLELQQTIGVPRTLKLRNWRDFLKLHQNYKFVFKSGRIITKNGGNKITQKYVSFGLLQPMMSSQMHVILIYQYNFLQSLFIRVTTRCDTLINCNKAGTSITQRTQGIAFFIIIIIINY